MRNIERNENTFSPQIETGDKEGTYEQKNGSDIGNQTVYVGNSSHAKVLIQKKVEKKQEENIIYKD